MNELELNLKKFYPNKVDALLLILSILSINNTNEILAQIIGLSFLLLALFFLFRKKYESYFIILLLNSYQSNGYGLYNLDLIGLSPIYFTQLLLLFLNIKSIRLSKRLITNFPLIIFLPISIIVGLFNFIDSSYYLKDISRFFIFFSSLFIFVIPEIRFNYLNSFLKYTLFLFPLLLIFNAILSPDFTLGQELNYFFDETSSVFIILCFSFLYHFRIKYKILCWSLFIFLIYLKISFFYFSTIELLALIILILIINLKHIKSLKILFKNTIIIFAFLFCVSYLFEFIPSFTIFKFYQLLETFLVLFNGIDFITLMPFSPKIRVLEFLNSYADLYSKSYFNLFFGNGFGSFFQFNFYPVENYGIQTLFDTGSYTDKEITQNKFFTGHNTLSFILIKMGLLSVLVFLRLFIISIYKYIRSVSGDPLVPVFSIYILMNLGYGNKNFILISFMICYLIFNKKVKYA